MLLVKTLTRTSGWTRWKCRETPDTSRVAKTNVCFLAHHTCMIHVRASRSRARSSSAQIVRGCTPQKEIHIYWSNIYFSVTLESPASTFSWRRGGGRWMDFWEDPNKTSAKAFGCYSSSPVSHYSALWGPIAHTLQFSAVIGFSTVLFRRCIVMGVRAWITRVWSQTHVISCPNHSLDTSVEGN